jgi:hypothetical protein
MQRSSTLSATTLLVGLLLVGPGNELAAQQRPALEQRKLVSSVVIDGIACAPTRWSYAEFYPSGRLASCPLAALTPIAGYRLPARTWVRLTEDGEIESVWLPQDTYLGDHLCRGTGDRGWSVTFHPTGVLRLCYLAREEIIEGIPCQKGSLWNEVRGRGRSAVHFREDGTLEKCQAARDFTRDGVAVKKWAVVLLNSAGDMRVQ